MTAMDGSYGDLGPLCAQGRGQGFEPIQMLRVRVNIADQQFHRGVEAARQNSGFGDGGLPVRSRRINDHQDMADSIHEIPAP
jgi:hypothetical protein